MKDFVDGYIIGRCRVFLIYTFFRHNHAKAFAKNATPAGALAGMEPVWLGIWSIYRSNLDPVHSMPVRNSAGIK